MAELLIELFSEEIPARMQVRAADDLKRLIADGLKAANLEFSYSAAYSTPRRLTVVVDGLPLSQPDLSEERKGPKVGAPPQAVDGFLKSVGLSSIDECEQRDTPKGAVYFAVIERKGRPAADVLSDIIKESVRQLSWPKSMRFADCGFRWVRPLHSVLAVFNGTALAGEIDLNPGARVFGNETHGHRFLGAGAFTVENFADYRAKLRDRHVILDHQERKAIIQEQLDKKAAAGGLLLKPDPALLDEVAGLVEWPVVLIGKIDEAFMEVPPEVLTTSMRTHQKYFALETADGVMAPRFAVVANMAAGDGGAAIIDGNERVLRARLSDAKFFWDQDRSTPLEERLDDLAKIIFHAKLGSVADRVDRIAALAEALADHVPGGDGMLARRAAQLAKADLVTEMVGEFPELQGVMGRYYALDQDEEDLVANAIAEHYSPAGPADDCPTAPTSVAVALAEKIDTLAGFWLIDEKPTGSKDPFALRRAALGVIRLVLENGLRLPLGHVFAEQFGLFAEQKLVDLSVEKATETALDLLAFFADRLKVHLREEGVGHDLITALFSLGDEDDLVRLVARVEALKSFLDSEDGSNLLVAYRRAANILRIEEKKDGTSFDGEPDLSVFVLDEEKALASALGDAAEDANAAREAEDFAGAMAALAGLRGPVDAFFDKVTVNADDAALRVNRLKLLSRIRATMGLVADFGQIEGDK